MASRIPRDHPRYESLRLRARLGQGFRDGLVHETGLIAHGRGEAFDYLLGERTRPFARRAGRAAAASLLRASRPVISLNGNVVALAARDCVRLAKALGARLEVNLFHRDPKRIRKLASATRRAGGKDVLGLEADARIPGLTSDRSLCSRAGIYSADVVLVPLEDGDRAQALRRMRKRVITIDLNPLSRTSRAAHVTIVDELTRTLPQLTATVRSLKGAPPRRLDRLVKGWDNRVALAQARAAMAPKRRT